ncbi:hypothetical protein KUBF_19510 [Bacteroides finegoldii]|nr:hypothetical protein KUBF_19510 [Bacteroides finegoldii]
MFWGPYTRPYASFIPSDFMSQVWSEENTDAYFPRPRGYVALNNNRELAVVNNKYLQNLAYCRLKNLSIGYTLPDKWLSKIGFEKIRIYFSGENLLTFTKLHSDYIDRSRHRQVIAGKQAEVMQVFILGRKLTLLAWI